MARMCAGAMALVAPPAWASPEPLELAREAVAAAQASADASTRGEPWSGWTRRGDALEREGWSLSALRLDRTETGWLARGEASLSGPRGLYVRADLVELDQESASASGTPGARAELVGKGWTIEGGRIEVDLERARATIIELGSTREEDRR